MLADWRSASLTAQQRGACSFIEQLTLRPDQVGPDDAAALRDLGVSEAGIVDLIEICALFSMLVRVVDALDVRASPPDRLPIEARILLDRGYHRDSA